MNDPEHYKKLARLDASPEEVFLAAKANGIGFIERLKLLRAVFGLSLVEAKEAWIRAEGLASTLSDYQEKFILPALMNTLQLLEQEEDEDLL